MKDVLRMLLKILLKDTLIVGLLELLLKLFLDPKLPKPSRKDGKFPLEKRDWTHLKRRERID